MRSRAALDDGSRPLSPRWLAFAVLSGAFVYLLYSVTFVDRPVVRDRIDTVADADASVFAGLLRECRPGRVFGNATEPSETRNLGDIAQAHKVKHSLYCLTGHVLWVGLDGVYDGVGMPEGAATHGVNAAISAINVALFVALCHGLGISLALSSCLTLLLALSVGPWVIGSFPESWPLTATGVLVFLFALIRTGAPAWLLGALLGVGMLNNPLLAGVGVLAAVPAIANDRSPREIASAVLSTVASALIVFFAVLSLLSLWDPALRPDNYLYTVDWFRQRNAFLRELRGHAPPDSPLAVLYSLSNAFGTAIVSNQPGPGFPVSSFRATLESWPGRVAASAYGLLALLAGVHGAMRFRRDGPAAESDFELVVGLAAVLGFLWLGGHSAYWPGAFLFSPAIVPLVLLSAGVLLRGLDGPRLGAAAVLCAVIVANNADQVLDIRASLAGRKTSAAERPTLPRAVSLDRHTARRTVCPTPHDPDASIWGGRAESSRTRVT